MARSSPECSTTLVSREGQLRPQPPGLELQSRWNRCRDSPNRAPWRAPGRSPTPSHRTGRRGAYPWCAAGNPGPSSSSAMVRRPSSRWLVAAMRQRAHLQTLFIRLPKRFLEVVLLAAEDMISRDTDRELHVVRLGVTEGSASVVLLPPRRLSIAALDPKQPSVAGIILELHDRPGWCQQLHLVDPGASSSASSTATKDPVNSACTRVTIAWSETIWPASLAARAWA